MTVVGLVRRRGLPIFAMNGYVVTDEHGRRRIAIVTKERAVDQVQTGLLSQAKGSRSCRNMSGRSVTSITLSFAFGR